MDKQRPKCVNENREALDNQVSLNHVSCFGKSRRKLTEISGQSITYRSSEEVEKRRPEGTIRLPTPIMAKSETIVEATEQEYDCELDYGT